MKLKIFIIIFVLAIALAGNVMASGDVEIYLRCNSPSVSIKNALGNKEYAGEEKRYEWSIMSQYGTSSSGYPVMRLSEDGYVDVAYRVVKPYVLRGDLFKANPNYYRAGLSGSGSSGWWIFEDSDSANYPPKQYHQYATPTSSKDSSITGVYYGQIKLTFKRFDGTMDEKIVNVQIQKRDCEAYNSGKWVEISPGRWE
jgi:hypothetical protein